MFFKILHRRSSKATSASQALSPPPKLEEVTLSKIIPLSTKHPDSTITTLNDKDGARLQTQESRDFDQFLQKAKREEEKRALKTAKDLEKRKKNYNMDPWSAKIGRL